MKLYRKFCVWRVLQYCVLLACLTPQGAWAVSIQDLVGSKYVQKDSARDDDGVCKWKEKIERSLTIQTGATARIEKEGQIESSSISGKRSKDRECEEEYGNGSVWGRYAVNFGGSAFDSTLVTGKDAGEVHGGTYRILEDGNLIILDYFDGSKLAF